MGLEAISKPKTVTDKYRQSQLVKGRKNRKVSTDQERAMGRAASSELADKARPKKGWLKTAGDYYKGVIGSSLKGAVPKPAIKKKKGVQDILDDISGKKK